MVDRDPIHGIQRRVTGYHDIRLDGMSDLLLRARGGSVLDVGCNRGMVAFEFANNGAALVHGCDKWEIGIHVAREVFADIRNVSSRFEVVDLSGGPGSLHEFGSQKYDFVLLLAVFLKLTRIMKPSDLFRLISHLGTRCQRYFAARSTEEHFAFMDKALGEVGLKRIHTSLISDLGPAAIWARAA